MVMKEINNETLAKLQSALHVHASHSREFNQESKTGGIKVT